MNQVGDILVFTAQGTLPGSPCPAYVWKFWDASVAVSGINQGTVSKRLNVGGNPAETALVTPFVLPYRVEICDYAGTVLKALDRQVAVNNPPTLYGSPLATPNNQAFPFATQVRLQAYDLENNGVKFFWYYGTNAIGGHDVTTGPVSVAGTYYGTLIGANRNSYVNVLSATVNGSGTVYTCKVVDNDGGTNQVHVPVQGFDPNAPQFSVAAAPNSLTADSTTLPDVVIAPGQTVQFTTYGYDPTPGTLVFTWYLYGSNGWNQPGVPLINHGVTTALAQGYRNDYTVSIANEHGNGVRTALATVTNALTGKTAATSIAVNMAQDNAPVMRSVGVYDSTGLQVIAQPISRAAHPVIRLSGTATDAENDVVYYQWGLTLPVAPTSMVVWGRDCFIDISNFPDGASGGLGQVLAYDKYGLYGIPFSLGQISTQS